MKALVIGGGMAGLCAAADLADNGVEVQLIEATDLLGGRATSWVDPDGDTVDNALHVFMPHYANCHTFLAKVGARPLHWTQGITSYDEFANHGDLPIGGGLGSIKSALNSPTMSKFDQLSLGMAVLAATLMSEEQLRKADEVSMLEWFKRHGATSNAITNFRPGGAGLTFLELNQVSAKALIYWLRAFLCKEFIRNPGIGFADGGLGEIYVEPARRYIEGKGGIVETGRRAKSLVVEDNLVKGVELADGETLGADVYLSAMPFYDMRRVLPEPAYDWEYFRNTLYIEDAPSASVQIWFDRFVTDMKNIAAQLRGTFNCFADMSTVVPWFAGEAGGSAVEYVLTPARHLLQLTDERIYKMVLEEFRGIMPAARDARVRKWVVVKKRQGVFAQSPGIDRYRPGQRTPYSNFYLCGDYTRTPISAGMENACASANIAASYILEDHLDVKAELFKKTAYLTPYLRMGVAAGAGAGLAFAARRALSRHGKG